MNVAGKREKPGRSRRLEKSRRGEGW